VVGVQPLVRGGDKWWRSGPVVQQIRETNDVVGTRLLFFGHFKVFGFFGREIFT